MNQIITNRQLTKIAGKKIEDFEKYSRDIFENFKITNSCKMVVYECQKCGNYQAYQHSLTESEKEYGNLGITLSEDSSYCGCIDANMVLVSVYEANITEYYEEQKRIEITDHREKYKLDNTRMCFRLNTFSERALNMKIRNMRKEHKDNLPFGDYVVNCCLKCHLLKTRMSTKTKQGKYIENCTDCSKDTEHKDLAVFNIESNKKRRSV